MLYAIGNFKAALSYGFRSEKKSRVRAGLKQLLITIMLQMEDTVT